MEAVEPKQANARVLVAILAMCSVMLAYSAIMPILNEVGKSFPDASTSAVQVVYSIAMLVSLPFMLAAGWLTSRFSKKALSIAGLLLLSCGALPAVLHGSLLQVYLGSALVGAGTGVVNIISSTLISDYYKGVQKGRIMGYQSAALSLMGGMLAFGGGQIAAMWEWWYAFLLFLVGLPIALVVFALLPQDTPARQEAGQKNSSYSQGVLVWAALAFFFSIFMYAFNTNIAMFIEVEGFGGPDVAGVVSTMFSFIGVPAGLVVGACVKLLRRNVVAIACGFCALGMVVIGVAPSLPVVYIGSFLFGLGFAIRNPCVVTFAAYLVPASGAAAAIALVQAVGTVAGFLSPFVVNFISALFGGSFRMTFLVCGIILAILAAGYYFLNPVSNEHIENDA